jgi:hypothetical protein
LLGEVVEAVSLLVVVESLLVAWAVLRVAWAEAGAALRSVVLEVVEVLQAVWAEA